MSDESLSRFRRNQEGPDLPWWVELLFVQVGLPDNWLRTFLKTRKKARTFFNENKKPVGYSILAFAAIIYSYPIVKQARLHNECVHGSKEYVKINISSKSNLNEEIVAAWANRFCNGGDLQ